MSAGADLERGREAYEKRAWKEAFESLEQAGAATALGPDDLELLAVSAYMIGDEEGFVDSLEGAHALHLEEGSTLRAVRCAFWIGISLATRGQASQATGWFGRAQRLLDRAGEDCVERGYLLVPAIIQHEGAGEWAAASATAAQAAEIAERFADRDLFALAVHEQGYATVRQGRADEGLAMIDEAMVAVTAGELSPIVTGLVYCSVISYCQGLYERRRAQQWTAALSRWCEEQPEMVAYSGQCLVHRAEIMQWRGEWSDALEEARRAAERFGASAEGATASRREGAVHYLQAEVHRLQGDLQRAEEEYRAAGRCGYEPQPGLSLLRLAQGDLKAAVTAIERAAGEAGEPYERAGLLPSYIEVMLAAGEAEAAARACEELERLAASEGGDTLEAMAAQSRGLTELAAGRAREALPALRRALHIWQELDSPFEAARIRESIGLACRRLGDTEAGAMELEAARETFERLGARPDAARVEALTHPALTGGSHGLSERELEVLRLICAGRTNRMIAEELVVSRRTVDRHVSNIFAKLDVSSRAAATAFAYEHDLV